MLKAVWSVALINAPLLDAAVQIGGDSGGRWYTCFRRRPPATGVRKSAGPKMAFEFEDRSKIRVVDLLDHHLSERPLHAHQILWL